MLYKKINEEKRIYFIYAILAVLAFLYFVTHSQARGINKDDIVSIHVFAGQHNFFELLERNTEMGLQPPLAALIFYCWSRITPATAAFLKVPSMIAVSISVYVIACIGKRLKNNFTGLVAGILTATSYYSFLECAFSIRTYGILVLFSSIVYWYHLKYTEEWNNGKITIATYLKYSVACSMLAYAHYFGVLLVFVLGIADIAKVGISRGKDRWKGMLQIAFPYAFSALMFLPWALIVVVSEYQNLEENNVLWTSRPTIVSTVAMIYYFFSNIWVTALFGIVIVSAIYFMIKRKKKELWVKMFFYYIIVCLSYFLITFTYSTYVKADGSMWVKRYFCGLMPIIYLVCAMSLDYLYEIKTTKLKYICYLCVIVFAFFNVYRVPLNSFVDDTEVYKGTIQYLEEENVEEQEDAVIYAVWWGDAFNYFYTDNFRNDKKPALLDLDGENIPETINTIYIPTSHVGDWDTYVTDPDFDLQEENQELGIVKYVRVK